MRPISVMLAVAALLIGSTAASRAAETLRAIGLAPVATTTEGEQRWAMIVGIDEYAKLPRMRYARQDAQAMAESLVKEAGFPKDTVVLMTDAEGGGSPRLPTRGNLLARINRLAETAGKKDLLLVFFSGHGVKLDGRGYLVPLDGNDKDESSLVPLACVKPTLETSPAQQRLLVLDACHSGAKDTIGAGPSLDTLAGAAFITLASCDSRQVSYGDEKSQRGVLTSALIDGLRGQADIEAEGNKDGVVTAVELFEYTALRVKQWGMQNGKTQAPKSTGVLRGRVELASYMQGEQIILPVTVVRPPTQEEKPALAIAPFDERTAKKYQEAWARYLKCDAISSNSIGMKLVLIPPGEFVMGSPEEETGRKPHQTQHKVKLTKPFMMGVCEVTQAQWKAVMTDNPSRFMRDELPVEMVLWDNEARFYNILNEKEKKKYRLPIEAEGEYACRSGTTSAFYMGNAIDAKDVNLVSSFVEGTRGREHENTVTFGSYQQNAWLRFDMHGNAVEWCADWYGDYATNEMDDPQGPLDGKMRVIRGGGWGSDNAELAVSEPLEYSNTAQRPSWFSLCSGTPVSTGALCPSLVCGRRGSYFRLAPGEKTASSKSSCV